MKKSIKAHFKRSKILLLYLYDAYDVNVWEKKFGRSTAYSCRTNTFSELHHFVEKE